MAALFRHSPAIGLRLCLLTLLSVALMFFDRQGKTMASVRAMLSTSILPIHYIVDRPLTNIQLMIGNIVKQEALRKENAYLNATQITLEAKLQKLNLLEAENNQLRHLLDAKSKLHNPVKLAQLLAIAPMTYHQIVLDIGSTQNVFEGQPVVDAKGVLGQVLYVSPLTSHVLLITDHRSAISVTIERTGMRAIVQGTGSLDNLALINLPKTADVKIGDQLITSGLDQKFPEGYPVGTISSINYSPGKNFTEITIKPAAQLHNTRLVLLVWPANTQSQMLTEQSSNSDLKERDNTSIDYV